MDNPTDQPAAHQTLDALIAEAIGAPRAYPPYERCEQLNQALRAEIGDLHLAARERLATLPEYSRDWYAITHILDATDEALKGDLGSGLMSAALQLAELGRQARDLASCANAAATAAMQSQSTGEGR